MAATLQRIIKAFAVHLALLLAAVGIAYGAVHGETSLSAAVRVQYEGQPADVLLQLVADARGRVVGWLIASFASGWLAASLFIAAAQRTQPVNERQAASRRGLWSGLLLATILASAGLAWMRLFSLGVSTDLSGGGFMAALIGGGVLVVLAYHLGTGLSVKAAMRPSVPGGTALPDFWS